MLLCGRKQMACTGLSVTGTTSQYCQILVPGAEYGMGGQAARATAPREVADEVRMQEKRAAQKTVREETALKTKIAKDKEQLEVVWTVRCLLLATV